MMKATIKELGSKEIQSFLNDMGGEGGVMVKELKSLLMNIRKTRWRVIEGGEWGGLTVYQRDFPLTITNSQGEKGFV